MLIIVVHRFIVEDTVFWILILILVVIGIGILGRLLRHALFEKNINGITSWSSLSRGGQVLQGLVNDVAKDGLVTHSVLTGALCQVATSYSIPRNNLREGDFDDKGWVGGVRVVAILDTLKEGRVARNTTDVEVSGGRD